MLTRESTTNRKKYGEGGVILSAYERRRGSNESMQGGATTNEKETFVGIFDHVHDADDAADVRVGSRHH